MVTEPVGAGDIAPGMPAAPATEASATPEVMETPVEEAAAVVAQGKDAVCDGNATIPEKQLSNFGQLPSNGNKVQATPVTVKVKIANLHTHHRFRNLFGEGRGKYLPDLKIKMENEGNRHWITVMPGKFIGVPGKYVIVDGHHRVEVLESMGYEEVEAHLTPSEVVDVETAFEWIFKNQKIRRNLDKNGFKHAAQQIYDHYKQPTPGNLKQKMNPLKKAKNGSDASERNDAGSITAKILGGVLV